MFRLNNFADTLKLQNTIGSCTNKPPVNDSDNDWRLDLSLYKACVCCGDVYNADSASNCPVNPWQ